ncbi:putative cytochrome c-552 [Rubellimicrobium mesophilum DSM 19309]|uniref:Putative cytochrome c-552 n=1 Tax=Rubellimicrobium mesophilum DSM 19309 TaxID=442562 RepID=A0A017HLP6_9RHOB|nr:c-type cytochrome [Rubellimicrobium mesophilum]EYD75286.1 putative cytochrome c-552 [Rubellimicrobium mesophilum DSM 19309]
MSPVLRTLATLALLGAAGGGAVVGFGLYDVSARAGHWPITAWVLHTTFRNAVELRAPAPSQVPELTDDLLRLGIRHFDGACRMCHAAPGEERPATIRAMEPEPPHIAEAVVGWAPNELGWIVREGVKMSGMPGWPAARDDEPWAVVAFLARVREMDAATYRELTDPPQVPEGAPPHLGFCAGCHGVDGRSGNPHIPRLDLQSKGYLNLALRTYREETRESGIMAQAASAVPEEALPALAEWFAEQAPAPGGQPTDPALASRGEALAKARAEDPEVPACVACHGPEPDPSIPGGPGPEIAGQYETYLATQLRLWREGTRGGGPRAELMAQAARHLDDDDIAALAAWYASLGPAPRPSDPTR